MSKYFPPYNNSSENIKVELDLSNCSTKKDIKDITHIDASGFASKTNLAALETEVDKIDTDKLKTVPNDLAKLSNVVKNDVVKKTDYNSLKSKVDGIDVSKYVGRTKYETDGKAIYDKIDVVEKKIPVLTDFVTTARFNHEKNFLATKTALTTVENKIPDVSTLATKTSLSSLLPVSTFNSKVTELEGKVTTVDNKFYGFVKKTDYSAEITKIKNDYATSTSLDSRLNDLKAQHISTEVKKITGIDNLPVNSDLNAISDTTLLLPSIENDGRMNVKFSGNYFVQSKFINPNASTIVNIYIVYKLDAISSTRNTDYTIQNALFGAVKITKNASDSSKNKYAGYGICFDESGTFSKGNINNGRNVLIFGVYESSHTHSTNNANNIYVFGDLFVQGINDTTLYAEKVYKTNFTVPNVKFVLSLHYNGDNSYFFVNGTQELKFKAKASQILKEKLCVGNLSSNWSNSESQKTGLYGNVYHFVNSAKQIDDTHRSLMIKHGIV